MFKYEHPLYETWRNMIKRCHSPRNKDYRYYGARKIVVCKRWRNNFWDFAQNMGDRPKGYTLDRKDNDKGYSPKNCHWGTRLEQSNNRGMPSSNKTGYLGVSYHKVSKKYHAQYRKSNLSYYNTPEEASIAYLKAKEKH